VYIQACVRRHSCPSSCRTWRRSLIPTSTTMWASMGIASSSVPRPMGSASQVRGVAGSRNGAASCLDWRGSDCRGVHHPGGCTRPPRSGVVPSVPRARSQASEREVCVGRDQAVGRLRAGALRSTAAVLLLRRVCRWRSCVGHWTKLCVLPRPGRLVTFGYRPKLHQDEGISSF
jgi:hypothetical protein